MQVDEQGCEGYCINCNHAAEHPEFLCAPCVKIIKADPTAIMRKGKRMSDTWEAVPRQDYRCEKCDKTLHNATEGNWFDHQIFCFNRDKDVVNNPEHYKSHASGVQCIQVTEHLNFCLGNVIKYVWRADMKGGVEDLKKARWYIDREIKRRDAE